MVTRREMVTLLAGTALAVALPLGAAAQDAAVARIQQFYDSVLGAMKTGGGASARFNALNAAVTRTFDIPTMTRLAVGQRCASIPAPKQQALQQAFGRFLVATYVNRLSGFQGERFEVTPTTESRAGGKLVRSRVISPSGSSTQIDYVVGGSGRAVDVYLNGSISELATRRAEFDSILASGGPDALEASLKERAGKLLGGG